jgi:hypothetical protein
LSESLNDDLPMDTAASGKHTNSTTTTTPRRRDHPKSRPPPPPPPPPLLSPRRPKPHPNPSRPPPLLPIRAAERHPLKGRRRGKKKPNRSLSHRGLALRQTARAEVAVV